MFQAIKKFILNHKIITGVILLIIIAIGYYSIKSFNKNTGETRYVLAQVERGTLVASVSGSGQVVAFNEMDIKPKTSGELTYVGVKNAQEVALGKLIAKIDPTDAQKSVRDAELNLEEAQFKLAKMKGVETSAGYIRGIKEKAEDDLAKAYEGGFNTVSNAFLDLPTVMTGLNNILFGYTFAKTSQNIDYYRDYTYMLDARAEQYKTDVYNSYQKAKDFYNKNADDYKLVSRFSGGGIIESLINQTYDTTKEIGEAIRNTMNLVQLYQSAYTGHGMTPNAVSDTHLSSLASYTSKITSYLSSLFSTKNTIETNKENLIETDYTIADQEIQVRKMQEVLDGAKKNLSYCFIYAPFDGMITEVKVKSGDSVSSGTTIATIVAKENTAEISLNEVDAAKVKIGQKAIITFDAIDGLSISGEVSEIDSIGTVNQGIVSYNTTVVFDTQDERVKPGMSATANIITDSKQNVLMVPNSALKLSNNIYYVQTFSDKSLINQSDATTTGIISKINPQQQSVEIGIASDSYTEIISGLNEGDQIISKTITSSSSTTTTTNIRGQGLFMSNPR